MSNAKTTQRWTGAQSRGLPECHGGKGTLDFRELVCGGRPAGRRLNFLHDNVLAPGVSIGNHRHDADEEYYYILAGHGTMTLDGVQFPVGPGDVTAVYPGGEHGLENTSKEDMRIIVIGLS